MNLYISCWCHILDRVNHPIITRLTLTPPLVGKSLIWVAILGCIVFYLYALISFALLRSSFDPADGLFCSTLWQCTVTVIRYGLVGDIFEVGRVIVTIMS